MAHAWHVCDMKTLLIYPLRTTCIIVSRQDCMCKHDATGWDKALEHTLSSCVGGVSGLLSVAAAPSPRLNRPPKSGSAYAVLGLAKTTATASARAPTQDASVFCHWGRGSAASCVGAFACGKGRSGGDRQSQ